MTARAADVFLGVDAGGTQTRAVAVSGAGEILGSGVAGPANHASGTLEQASASIAEAVALATLFHRGRTPLDVGGTFIGSAGLEDTGGEGEGRRLLGDRVASRQVHLDSDAYVAWAGAFLCRPGIVAIAGTGSMCLGVDAAGRRVKAGGWGWRVGDEGSAYAIAVEAMRAALQFVDGRGDAGMLWQELARFTGRARGQAPTEMRGPVAVRTWLYQPDRQASDIAAFARQVERAAMAGCHTSLAILGRAGAQLAAMAGAVGGALAVAPALPVAAMGGVLEGSAVVRSAFAQALQGCTGVGAVVAPAYRPAIGAALLALRAAGRPLHADLLARLDQTVVPSEAH
jgi:N-acetylglucosamine kinase-like BadF-type ATPase